MKNRDHASLRLAGLGVLAALWAVQSPAAITATSGDVSAVAPPASVDVGDTQSDVTIFAFEEVVNHTVTAAVATDITLDRTYDATDPTLTPGSIGAGAVVNSYFLHADVDTAASATVTGSITFDAPVVGILTGDASLDATDAALGSATTAYPTGTSLRGLNFAGTDVLTLSADRLTVEVTWPVHNVTDQIRIITRTPITDRITFSMDFQGPTRGVAGGWGNPLFEGDILTPSLMPAPGPWPPVFGAPYAPGRVVEGAGGGAGPNLGLVPTPAGVIEVDALSYGRDSGRRVRFSVDEWAQGSGGIFNAVAAEAAATEAAADIFTWRGTIFAPLTGNLQYEDGDASSNPGVGLLEPNAPAAGLPDAGDNLDAFDSQTRVAHVTGPIFFSLDASFGDPLEMAVNTNSGSAIANGFVGGDVLVTPNPMAAAPAPVVFIPANALGLDRVPGAGPDSDDLDALALHENGNQVFEPQDDGVFDPAGDWILFSVRRNSAVIGQPDSRFGIPIDAGDILTVPVPGGMSPFPAIQVRAERLGLATFRVHDQCGQIGGDNGQGSFGCDDLDGLDTFEPTLSDTDSDGDGVPDYADNCTFVANADQRDTNGDGYGNRCDIDFNGNCVGNIADLAILKSVFFTASADEDIDGDGTVNFNDLVLFKSMYLDPPGPGLGSCP